MHKSIFVLLFLSFVYVTYGEDYLVDHFELTAQKSFPSEDMNKNNTIIKSFNGTYYFFEKPSVEVQKNSELIIYKDSAGIVSKLSFALSENNWITDFVVDNNNLVIISVSYFYFYKVDNGKLILERKIEDKDRRGYSSSYLCSNGNVLLAECCFACGNPGTLITVIDRQSGTVTKKELPNPKGYQLTFFCPKRLISFYNDKLAVADVTDFSIRIYDSQVNLLEVISMKTDWVRNQIFENELDKMGTSSRKLTSNVGYFQNQSNIISKIMYCDFISDSTILVCTSILDSNYHNQLEKATYYLLKKQTEAWSISRVFQSFPIAPGVINKSPIEYYFKLPYYQVNNGRIQFTSMCKLDLDAVEYKNKSNKFFYDTEKNYLENNPLIYSLHEFKIVEKK